MDFATYDQAFEESQNLFKQAEALLANKAASAEDVEKGKRIFEDATKLRERSKMLQELDARKGEVVSGRAASAPGGFKSLGEMLTAIYATTFQAKYDPRLKMVGGDLGPQDGKSGWQTEKKDMVENVGAGGGFLVFPEHVNTLFQMNPLAQVIRSRAFVLPMRSRVMQIPVLDQTGVPATGSSSYYGGVLAQWTEEAAYKQESEPQFRQMELVAHKLVTYTEASDELLADSAVPLEALLQQLFRGAILNEEEWAFVNGTGVGQPLGIVTGNATAGLGPTIIVARAVPGAIGIVDIFNMVAAFQGASPIWIAHQSTMPQILGMAGPAGNPSYVWIGNGRDQMPTTLMGYPIYFVENAQPLGTMGDIILADLSKYVIGDRQMVTVDASKHYRFRYDLTSWRAVHRVDGRPWLSTPITYRDGVTQVSPFVILDGAGQGS